MKLREITVPTANGTSHVYSGSLGIVHIGDKAPFVIEREVLGDVRSSGHRFDEISSATCINGV